MKVTCIRTAMIGGGLAYDVYVKVADTPEHVRKACPGGSYHTIICRDDVEYYDYKVATRTPENEAMPQGWDRYEVSKAHEDKAEREMLVIARKAFPELEAYQGDKIPFLWANGLLPKETSAKVELEI